MRTVTFRSVLHGVAKLMGIDPAEGDYTDSFVAAVAESVNLRVREGWEWTYWPEWTLTEERTPDANNVIEYEQAGETVIGEIFGVSSVDPGEQAARWVTWRPTDEGILITAETVPDPAYVKFRQRPPEFSGEEWDATVTYAVGDLVYVDDARGCFRSIQAGMNQDPETETAYWTAVEFPYVLANFVKRAVYADMLQEDGQDDKAQRQESRAYAELLRAVDVVEEQQGLSMDVQVDTGA